MTQSMIITLGLAIVGQIVYQIGQRAVPAHAPPLFVLTAAYLAAAAICIALAVPFGAFSSGITWRPAFAWPTWLLAGAIVGIEVGYLLAFRAGWTLGTAFATASTVTVVVLALVDWFVHGNALSLRQIGIAGACAGVWLLSTGRK